MFDVRAMFPKASQSFIDANASDAVQVNVERPAPYSAKMLMNKTESSFAARLEAMKMHGDIESYHYEGMTLRWESGVDKNGKPIFIRYTADFLVFYPDQSFRLIEVKGRFVKGKFERAVERFRHARTRWPQIQFQLWQLTKDGWGTPRI